MVEHAPATLDAVFHALADRTRRAMLRNLSGKVLSISEIAEPFAMSFAAASKHVKVLESAGLVRRTVQGRTHLCSLEAEGLREATDWLSFYDRFWSDRLDALDEMIGQRAGDRP
ncbi:ArsR/SmtB family transcription factor [Methylobacterium soli]|uniref:Helix-turn-helix transcriptional regulator n=1 Tax=Methylobacterium soli TaxID=553447 RepID=A0A6L3SYU8_9HYPH|nr:metalloregulator ArsR/SmtB family transcription factor [Methylobacterium soli]KAB1078730.1 helix-turn-helix transcriptional regulator [Methylobacterium soli]